MIFPLLDFHSEPGGSGAKGWYRMTFKKRLSTVSVLLVIAILLYGTARFYAPSLVYHVVEQTLIQKAPPEMDPALLRHRINRLISAAPDREARMEQLFRISEYLEKVQILTPEQLNELLPKNTSSAQPGTPAGKPLFGEKGGTFLL